MKDTRKSSSRQMRHYYQQIIYNMPYIVYLLDKDCQLTGGNRCLLELLDIQDFSELKTTLYNRLIQHCGFSLARIDTLKRMDIDALLSKTSQYNVEEPPIVDKNGEILYYFSDRIPLFNENKEIIGLMVILKDRSKYRSMAEQIQKLTQQLQEKNAQPTPMYVEPNRDRATPPKVLMIEDNILVQKATQSLLMQLDCHVDTAGSVEEATRLFKPGKYDLIFMDIGLEDTSGYVLAKKIRQIEGNVRRKVPIIALTGFEADSVKSDCDIYSMEGAITKPLTSEQAKEIIQHYIYQINVPVRGLKSGKEMG